jgi:ribosomal protein L24E
VWKTNCVLFYVKTKPLKIKWTDNFKELVKVTVLIANVYLSTNKTDIIKICNAYDRVVKVVDSTTGLTSPGVCSSRWGSSKCKKNIRNPTIVCQWH